MSNISGTTELVNPFAGIKPRTVMIDVSTGDDTSAVIQITEPLGSDLMAFQAEIFSEIKNGVLRTDTGYEDLAMARSCRFYSAKYPEGLAVTEEMLRSMRQSDLIRIKAAYDKLITPVSLVPSDDDGKKKEEDSPSQIGL